MLMNEFWKQQRVLVTGGAGFVGRHLARRLKGLGAKTSITRSRDYDLTRETDVKRCLRDIPCDMVIHLAAKVGGIGANRVNPGVFFYDNLMMGALLMEHSRRIGIKKFVQIGTICAYPKMTPVPFKEDDLWNGYPEETNAPYGIAKKALLVQAQAYRKQYDFNAIYLLPVNLYGPGDNFDLDTSHVVPAMIRKFLEAAALREPEVPLWGTGRATREFLYVEDAVEGICLAAQHYRGLEPVNLGSGREISIRAVAKTLQRLTGNRSRLVWDANKPDGQPRRCLDVSRAREYFGWTAKTSLEDGFKRTIAWYAGKRGFPLPPLCRP